MKRRNFLKTAGAAVAGVAAGALGTVTIEELYRIPNLVSGYKNDVNRLEQEKRRLGQEKGELEAEKAKLQEERGKLQEELDRIKKLPEPPEPQVVTPDINVGVYYITGWGTFQGRSSDWSIGTDLHPILGFYRSDNPTIASWHIHWLVTHGIRHVMVLSTNPGRGSISGWENNFENGFLKSKLLPFIDFSMVFNNGPFREKSKEERMALTRHAISYFARNYFPHPQYKRVDGKPMVDLHQAFIIADVFGLDELEATVKDMRKTAKENGYEIFLVGDVFNWQRMGDERYEKEVIPMFDAISSYTVINAGVGWKFDSKGNVYIVEPYDSMVEGYIKIYQHYSAKAKEHNVRLIPPTTPGFDNSILYKGFNPKGTDDWLVKRTNPTLEKFGGMLKEARKYVDPKLRMISIEAQNEFQEASVIEPTIEYGFQYHGLIRNLFAQMPAQGWPPRIFPYAGEIMVAHS